MVSPINNHTGIRFIIGGIVAAISILAFGGDIARAATIHRPNAAFNADGTLTPDAWNVIQDPVNYPPPVGSDSQSDVNDVLNRSRRLGGITPKASEFFDVGRSFPGLTLRGVGFTAALALAQVGGSGYVQLYKLITGDYGTSASGAEASGYTAASYGWRYVRVGYKVDSPATTGAVGDGFTAPATGWYLDWSYCNGSCTPPVISSPNVSGSNDTRYTSALGPAVSVTVGAASMGGQVSLGGGVYAWYATDAAFENATHMQNSDSTTYNNSTTQIDYGPTAYSPTPDEAGAASAFGVPGAGQTAAQAAAEGAVAQAVDPLDTGEGTMALLAPIPNETYGDYIARLQAAGWVGSVTTTEESVVQDGYGPDAVTRVLVYPVQSGTGTRVYDPLFWPAPSPLIGLGQDLEVRYNPDTATPVPYDGEEPGSGEPGNCSDCSIDWTPIESLNFGSAFPFGLPGWVSSFFGNFNQSGTCPTLSIGKPDVLGGGTEDVSFCSSDWENTWRPIVFPVLEALMTAAGVVFFATKILGYGNADS